MFFEPTDRRKAIKPLLCNGNIEYASPNLVELKAMANFLSPNNNIKANNELNEIIDLSRIVLQSVSFLLVTRGAKGVVTVKYIKNNNILQIEVRVYNAETINSIENASGAGDCFSSGLIHGILTGLNESQCIRMGFNSAKEALLSRDTVPRVFKALNTFNEAECTVLTI